jgi:hypothetical protein
MTVTIRGVRVCEMFVKLCRHHPERVTARIDGLIDSLVGRLQKPRIRVKAISRRVA